MSDERTKIAGKVIDVLTWYGFMRETPEETAGAILRPEFFDRSGDGDVAKADVVSIFYDDPDAARLLGEARAEALFADPNFRALLSRLIAPSPAQPTMSSQRFAETAPIEPAPAVERANAPTVIVGGKLFIAPPEAEVTLPPQEMCMEEPAPAGLELATVIAEEEGRGARPSIGVSQEAFAAEPPKEGAEVLMPGESYFTIKETEAFANFPDPQVRGLLPQARKNLELALKDMQRGRDGVDDITKQRIRNIYIAITEGRLQPEGDLTLARMTASDMIRLFAQHPINALIWAERLVAANIGTGIDLGGERLIVPKAKANWLLYKTYDELRRPERFYIPGTSLRITGFRQFPEVEAALDELTAYLEQYSEVRARLAEEKPELFGAEAIQRLKDRLGTIRMIRHASTRRERTELLAEAVKDGILPPVPTHAGEENMDASSERQRVYGKMRYREGTEMSGPRGEYWHDAEGAKTTFRDNYEALVQSAEFDSRFADGELVSDVAERFDRSMRLVDLHSAGLARDISVLIEVFETVGAISEVEGRAAILKKLPSLAEMEHMWRPGQASARTPNAVLERAGINYRMPTLQEPDRLARKRLRGKLGVVEEFSRLLGVTSAPEVDYGVEAVERSVAMVVASEDVSGLSYEAKVVRLIHAAHEFARAGNREGLLETLRGLATLMEMQPNELIGQFRRGTRDSVVLRAVRTAIGDTAIETIGGLIRRGKTGEAGAGATEDAVRGGELGRVK